MKNLTFASLRGTKTAIHCKTQSEAEQVKKICGFVIGPKGYYNEFGANTVIFVDQEAIDSNGQYDSFQYAYEHGYTIITAADFIAANSGKPQPPTDYVPLFNHLANEHGLTLIDSELREIALKVPIPENSLLEKIENMKKLIRIGVIVTKPKDRHDDLLTAIGQIEAEAKKVFER